MTINWVSKERIMKVKKIIWKAQSSRKAGLEMWSISPQTQFSHHPCEFFSYGRQKDENTSIFPVHLWFKFRINLRFYHLGALIRDLEAKVRGQQLSCCFWLFLQHDWTDVGCPTGVSHTPISSFRDVKTERSGNWALRCNVRAQLGGSSLPLAAAPWATATGVCSWAQQSPKQPPGSLPSDWQRGQLPRLASPARISEGWATEPSSSPVSDFWRTESHFKLNHNEIPPHTRHNGHYQKMNRYQVWVRMWGEREPLWLLVRVHTGAAPRENSMKITQKTRKRSTTWPSNSISGYYPKKTKTLFENKDACMCVFSAALLTRAKIWKQSRCPVIDEWTKKMWGIYTMEFYSTIKRTKFCHLGQQGWIWRVLC